MRRLLRVLCAMAVLAVSAGCQKQEIVYHHDDQDVYRRAVDLAKAAGLDLAAGSLAAAGQAADRAGLTVTCGVQINRVAYDRAVKGQIDLASMATGVDDDYLFLVDAAGSTAAVIYVTGASGSSPTLTAAAGGTVLRQALDLVTRLTADYGTNVDIVMYDDGRQGGILDVVAPDGEYCLPWSADQGIQPAYLALHDYHQLPTAVYVIYDIANSHAAWLKAQAACAAKTCDPPAEAYHPTVKTHKLEEVQALIDDTEYMRVSHDEWIPVSVLIGVAALSVVTADIVRRHRAAGAGQC